VAALIAPERQTLDIWRQSEVTPDGLAIRVAVRPTSFDFLISALDDELRPILEVHA
jgi:hypothetical protein